MKHLAWLTATSLVASSPAFAQVSPYTSYQDREIKALSPEEVAAYRSGEGMGYALAAELNAYPGPRHVLDMADSLGLDQSQRIATSRVLDEMRERAIELGVEIVAMERSLDSLFVEQDISDARLRVILAALGRLEAELRHAHLSAHLEMTAILTEHQRHEYARLRGYGADSGHEHRRN